MTESRKTALYEQHVRLNARLVSFAGYTMPVQYTGIIPEHLQVRSSAGLFDVSHMGEFKVRGPRAEKFLQKMTVNDVSRLEVGQAQYSAMCYENGGIVDDLLVYRFPEYYLMVVNAANITKDFDWLSDHLEKGVTLTNHSDEIGLIALQGPRSREFLQRITDLDLTAIDFYHSIETDLLGHPVAISRTGYTGELGFEIYAGNAALSLIWGDLSLACDSNELKPIGLGARDTLRLEMKYCLYGNDIDATTTPVEAGLSWIVKQNGPDFIGKQALNTQMENWTRKLICLEMLEKAVPRTGYPVYAGDQIIGNITSGTQSPSLQKGIGLAYLQRGFTRPGTEIQVEIRGLRRKAVVVKPPFYKQGTVNT